MRSLEQIMLDNAPPEMRDRVNFLRNQGFDVELGLDNGEVYISKITRDQRDYTLTSREVPYTLIGRAPTFVPGDDVPPSLASALEEADANDRAEEEKEVAHKQREWAEKKLLDHGVFPTDLRIAALVRGASDAWFRRQVPEWRTDDQRRIHAFATQFLGNSPGASSLLFLVIKTLRALNQRVEYMEREFERQDEREDAVCDKLRDIRDILGVDL